MTVHKFKGIKPPISWMGGKATRAKWILEQMEDIPHKIYCEVFGGSGAVMFAKEPKNDVYNDVDSGLVNMFEVLADPELFEKFKLKINLLPYSRELFGKFKREYPNTTDPLEKAVQFFYIAKASFAGLWGSSWGYGRVATKYEINRVIGAYINSIDRLEAVHQRMRTVTIEHDDFRKILPRWDTDKTLFYLDPPYCPETRTSGKYKHEMTTHDHLELIDIILSLEGSVVLSSYPTKLYDPLLDNGFKLITKEISCNAAGRTKGTGLQGKGSIKESQKRIECLYIKEK